MYFGLQNNSQQNWKLDKAEPPFDIEGHKITGLTPKLYFKTIWLLCTQQVVQSLYLRK